MAAQGQGGYQNNDKVSNLRSQVDDVRGVMSQNIERVMERGEKLDDLVEKTNDLEQNAVQFRQTSRKVKKKMWWKNTKMTLILVAVVVVIILIIILSLVKWPSSTTPTVAPPTIAPTKTG